jgi:ubiquinone/menaquinone biosynthesis C-methylase UbiE
VPTQWIRADLRELPLPDGAAAAVLCLNGLHVLHDPAPALREFRRVLEPGGLLTGTSLVRSARAAPAQHVVRRLAGLPAPPPGTVLRRWIAGAGFTTVVLEGGGGLVGFSAR